MDAVIQVEATHLRAIVTECAEIFVGRKEPVLVSIWTTVIPTGIHYIKTCIQANAPNSSYILV